MSKSLSLFQQIAEFDEEFKNPVTPEQDRDAYTSRACERDARQYAEKAAVEYFRCLEEHLELIKTI